jgi:peptidoglycan lytic transglycosylase G
MAISSSISRLSNLRPDRGLHFMTRRTRFFLLGLILLFLPLIGWGGYFFDFLRQPVAPPTATSLTISRGSSLRQVARQLEHAGVIRDAWQFRLLGKLRGDAQSIRTGDYDFTAAATPGAVLDRLVAGDIRKLKLTIPEGFDLQQIAARADQLLGIGGMLLRLSRDPDFLARLGIKANSLEGYLFPETYSVTSETTAEQLLRMMLVQLHQHLTAPLKNAAERHGLSIHQLLTLASIIQKEAGNDDEMPLISAVFHNRLQKKIPLQADPTVIYGLESFDGNLTRAHLQAPTPYNTYRINGLPPGPIASPGLRALQAAAEPAESTALYFVARGDGTHVFSDNLRQHNQAVRRFQLKRKN